MEIAALPISEDGLPRMSDVKAQQTKVLGYKLAKDPKPGAKVMHAIEAIDHVTYGLAARMESHISLGPSPTLCTSTTRDLFPVIMVTYLHPDRTFEIEAPAIICDRAPQELHFTTDSEKHGSLPYHLTRINEYTRKHLVDKTKSIISCVIEPTGTDVALSNDSAIELCFTKEAKHLGFCVTRFTRATTRKLKAPINKFYCDLEPTASAPPAANVLKFFKMINGPSGSAMTVNFKEKSLTKLYKNLCPKCLAVTTHKKCACPKNKRKRGRSNSANKKAAKLARVIQTFEDAYKNIED